MAPFSSGAAYDSALKKVNQELSADKNRTTKHCNELATKYNLSWVHLVDKDKSVSLSTRPSGLPESTSESSRVVEMKGTRFVEMTEPFEGSSTLSVGFRCPSLLDALFTKQIWPGQLPFGTAATVLLLNTAAILVAYLLFLGLPLQQILQKLSAGQDLPEKFAPLVSSELEAISSSVKSRFASQKDEHEKNISSARADLSGVFAKEVDERIVHRLGKEIVSLKSSAEASELVIRRFMEEYSGVVKAGFAVSSSDDGKMLLLGNGGFNEDQLKTLSGLSTGRFGTLVRKISAAGLLKADELGDKKLETLMSEMGSEQCLVMPIIFNAVPLTQICIFVTTRDQSALQKIERAAKRMNEQLAPTWNLLCNFEEAYRLSRFDYLTGARNRVSLTDMLDSLTKESDKKERIFLIFEGDNFRVMLGSYGPRTIDRLIQELAQELLSALEQSVRYKKASLRIKFADYFYRIGGCRFLLILEDANLKRAVEITESVIQTVAERKDWAHGMPSWSISCAVAAAAESNNAHDVLEEAMITIDFIRSKKSSGVVVVSKDVPPEFMSRAQQRNLSDSMTIFNPVNLITSLTENPKTGILTVTNAAGRVFWANLEKGQIVKARLGKLCGDAAIIEFICEFDDGTHRVQDLSTLDTQSQEDLKSLAGAYLVGPQVKELCDFGAKSKDAAAAARVHLKTPEMIVHPTVDKQNGQLEAVFYKLGKAPHPLHLKASESLWELSNGRLNFDEIVARLQDEYPMALIWAAGDFLLQNKLIKFSRLRVSTHTDGSVEQVAVAAAAAKNNSTAAVPAPSNTGFVGLPRMCSACRMVDPLSQRFCVHCGAEMVAVSSNNE